VSSPGCEHNASRTDTGDAGGSTQDGSACYSPTLGLELTPHPLEPDAGPPGCACDPSKDEDVCAPFPGGGRVALFCIDGRWKVGWDGPCQVNDGGATSVDGS
jgi:hypothetical protein